MVAGFFKPLVNASMQGLNSTEHFNEPTHGNDDVFASVLETHSIYKTSTEVY